MGRYNIKISVGLILIAHILSGWEVDAGISSRSYFDIGGVGPWISATGDVVG